MSSLTSSLTHKRSRKHRWRWIVLIVAGLLAITWRAQSAARNAQRQDPLSTGASSPRSGGTATQDRPTPDAPKPKQVATAPEPASPSTNESVDSNPTDAADTSGSQAGAAAETAEGSTEDAEPAAGDASTDGTEVVPAGEDERGTFRPVRAVTDAYGVVVTGTPHAGLEGASKWVEGGADGSCPEDFPIKGNASSRIYHMPGESSYERTIPEFCFASEEDAAEAGFRPRAR